jgi:hypothetical protein
MRCVSEHGLLTFCYVVHNCCPKIQTHVYLG